MSSMETNVGRLCDLGMTPEQMASQNGMSVEEWRDHLYDDFEQPPYLVIGNKVHAVEWVVYGDADGSLEHLEKVSDPGSIPVYFFATQHHNGGASLEEVLESLLEKEQ